MKHKIILLAIFSIALALPILSPRDGIFAPASVQAADALTDTFWVDVDDEFDFKFHAQGKVTHNLYPKNDFDGDSIQGTYKINGRSVEMNFAEYQIVVSATVNGNKMSGRINFDGDRLDFEANKQ